MKNNLKQIRESQGKLQETVASDLKISLSTYRSWEHGTRNLNGAKLAMLAKYFDVSTDTIIGTQFSAIAADPDDVTDEQKLFELFSALNDDGQSRLLEIAEDMLQLDKFRK